MDCLRLHAGTFLNDVIVVCESHLNSSISDNIVHIDGYDLFRYAIVLVKLVEVSACGLSVVIILELYSLIIFQGALNVFGYTLESLIVSFAAYIYLQDLQLVFKLILLITSLTLRTVSA